MGSGGRGLASPDLASCRATEEAAGLELGSTSRGGLSTDTEKGQKSSTLIALKNLGVDLGEKYLS